MATPESLTGIQGQSVIRGRSGPHQSDRDKDNLSVLYPVSISWTKWPDCLREGFSSSLTEED